MKAWLENLNIVQFYRLCREMGWLRSLLLIGGLFALIAIFVALDVWLKGETGWPDAYGFHCHRKCIIEDMWHSPALLQRAGAHELALFALIWWMPVLVAGCLMYALVKRRRRNPILPLKPTE